MITDNQKDENEKDYFGILMYTVYCMPTGCIRNLQVHKDF